jgi:methionine synthase II (cobalamin-independent)
VHAVVARVAGLWRRLGLPPQWCAERVVLTPACGLAGASPEYARTALARCRDAARALREELES